MGYKKLCSLRNSEIVKPTEIQLPANRRFGLFFTAVFVIISVYYLYLDLRLIAYTFILISAIFFSIAIIKPILLLPLNKLWMRFGLLLGIVISPIMMGVIFFGIITPVALITRLFGRDELNLKISEKNSCWIERKPEARSTNFKNQF